MACSGCPGGGGARYPTPPRMAQQNGGPTPLSAMQPREGYAVVKYNGLSAGTRVYRGDKTQTNYRFGHNASHQMSYVYVEDVDWLLGLSDGGRPLFELVQSANQQAPEAPTLVAAGPPAREVANSATLPRGSGPAVVERILGAPTGRQADLVTDAVDGDDHYAEGNLAMEPVPALQDYSVSELRQDVAAWPVEKVALYLAHEKTRPQPRTTVVTLLERRLAQGS